mgnify:CR=1 FL=1
MIRPLLRTAAARLAEAGVPSPDYDAAELLAHVLGCRRPELGLAADPTPAQRQRYDDLVTRRARREPIGDRIVVGIGGRFRRPESGGWHPSDKRRL